MGRIAQSLWFAVVNLAHPRILWMMVWPVLIATTLWGAVVIVFWAPLVVRLAELISGVWLLSDFVARFDLGDAVAIASKILLVVALVPLIQFTSLLIIGLFAMPAMVEHVSARAFPTLERRRGGSFAGSVSNGLVAVAGFAVLGLLSLPLWLLLPLWPFIPVAIFGWMNQRLLRYDALAEHASSEEMMRMFRKERGALLTLGVLLALAAYVPVAGLFAPVLFGLACIHYLLSALERERTGPVDGTVILPASVRADS